LKSYDNLQVGLEFMERDIIKMRVLADAQQQIKKLINDIRVREDIYHCIDELAKLGTISELDLYDAFLMMRERTEIPLRVLKPMYQAALDTVNKNNIDWPDVRQPSGNPLSTYNNFKHLCEIRKIKLTQNLMTHSCDATINDEPISEAELLDIIISAGLTGYKKTIKAVSKRLAGASRAIHPIDSWLGDEKWDGVDRIDFLIEKLNFHQCTEALVRIYLTRWLLGAMDAVYSPAGATKQSMLVLQGKSGCGKTTFFESLLPQEHMHEWFGVGGRVPFDRRNLIKNIHKWLIEVPSFQEYLVHGHIIAGRRSNLTDMSLFLDRHTDTTNYGTTERRMFFCAGITTNEIRIAYSADRHYFVIPIDTIKFHMEIDQRQLWLQIKELYNDGQRHILLKSEFKKHMRYANVLSTRPNWTDEKQRKNSQWLKR
jgi:Virulence-associated protein E-like domain